MAHKGIALKQAREAKGISLESVHEATKIPMDCLRAIEEGYTVRTLTSFYYKGFIKMYAQYLGVDATEILAEVKVKDDEPKTPIKQGIKREIKAPPQFNYDSGIDLKEQLGDFFTSRRKQQIIAVVGLLIGLVVLFQVVSSVGGWFRSRSAKKRIEQRRERVAAKEQRQQAQVDQSKIVRTVASQPATGSSTNENKPSAPIDRSVSLTVRAKNNVWLQVKSDQSVVFQSTLHKGDVETWKAKERLELSGKNINELEFELNGKMIGTLGRADRRARKLFVTSDGLTVKR